MELKILGWNQFFEEHFEKLKKKDCLPARILRIEKSSYHICTREGMLKAKLSGILRYRSDNKSDLPSVGDWVSTRIPAGSNEALIDSIIPRKNEFSRKAPISGGRKIGMIGDRETIVGGKTEKQVIAANLDLIFYIAGLDRVVNIRLIERIITSCWESDTKLVIILNKADLKTEEEICEIEDEIQRISLSTPVHTVSAINHKGFNQLDCYFKKGVTISLLGYSGAGKSTFINHFLEGNFLKTGAVRNRDKKGKHTTTWRELLLVPKGGIIIDNPGIREMQLWTTPDDINRTFEDIEELSHLCKFKNCTHNNEPGCAILDALQNDRIDETRYLNYIKMHSETLYLLSRKAGL